MEPSLETIALLAIAAGTVGAAGVAFALRDIIRCALLLIASWFGVAAFYLWADAEFIAFAQVLVYVGAISMIVLFAVLLTRRDQVAGGRRRFPGIPLAGAAVAALVALVLVSAVLATPAEIFGAPAVSAPEAGGVGGVGTALVEKRLPEFLAVGVLLTVALLGAVLVAAPERK